MLIRDSQTIFPGWGKWLDKLMKCNSELFE